MAWPWWPALWRWRLLALAPLLWLAGCASLTSEPVAVARPARATITHYSFDGGLAIRQGNSAWRVSLSWQHAPEGDRIVLSGPLGQGLAEITRDANGARLVDAKGKVYSANDASTLLRDVVGIPAPIDSLPRWVLADIANATPDAAGRPLHAQEAGWNIDYLDYESPRADALPQRLQIERDDLSVTLRIDQWQLDTP